MARILIADDSAIMRKILGTIFTDMGHTIAAEASSGYEACVEFERQLPDLLTLDINMPFISGTEALRAILSKHPKAKIIMVSSQCSSSLISHALNMGAKDYIIKPFSLNCLVNTVNNVLQCDYSLEAEKLKSLYSKINAL